jgi:hypothetical protein
MQHMRLRSNVVYVAEADHGNVKEGAYDFYPGSRKIMLKLTVFLLIVSEAMNGWGGGDVRT